MRALFLGEGDLDGPARYLAAVLTWSGIAFDHRPDQASLPRAWERRPYDVIILSDYRYSSWSTRAKKWLINAVEDQGTGLLMIGGWASFTGLVGAYAKTDLEKLLPVRCQQGDDRIQNSTGALLVPRMKEREGADSPPLVCGYHRATPKPGSHVMYAFRDLSYRKGRLLLGKPRPAVVVGHAGRGRATAFLTDCAPHWAGGLVDWGHRRVTVHVKRGVDVEVGERYLKFMRQLIVGVYSNLSRKDGLSSK